MTLETAVPLASLTERAVATFTERFGRAPTVVTAAPGRVNLIGEHTDYNDGFVLPMAIERYTVVAADAASHGEARLTSATMGDTATLSLTGDTSGEQPGWAPYVSGVLSVYGEEGLTPPPLDAVIDSTVPLGGGLSSSAALEVSLALAIEALAGQAVEPSRRALLCQQAEHRAGMPCGIMDQFSSALCQSDHLMLLDCRSQEPTMAPLTDPDVSVLIINSNVKHELTGGEYAERRRQCEEAAEALGVDSLRDVSMKTLLAAKPDLATDQFKRARHVVGEIDRTRRAAEALGDSDWPALGALMYASHAAMRDDFEITVPEIDFLVEAAAEIGEAGGVIGSRMTGGGFGGCTVSLVRADAAESIAAQIAERYREKTGIASTQFVTRPARGAHRVL